MLLNEDDLTYVAKRIKEETGTDMILKKVHIDNVIPVTEENRKMFLDSVVNTYINLKDSKGMTAKEFDDSCDLKYQTINTFVDGKVKAVNTGKYKTFFDLQYNSFNYSIADHINDTLAYVKKESYDRYCNRFGKDTFDIGVKLMSDAGYAIVVV